VRKLKSGKQQEQTYAGQAAGVMEINSLQDLLKSYRDAARTERDKGTYFKRLAIAFLSHDPVQVEQYEDVRPYKEWAISQGWDGRDTGIDLVAKLRDEEGYAAIQCKFYDPNYRIRKEDIDSFISASGKKPFKRRVIIDTTERTWSENAETMIRGQDIPTIRIGLNDLQESPILWERFAAKGEVVLADKKRLREHQKDALRDVRAGLTEADRGKMIMACGTGKTFTSLKIAEDLTGQGKCVLYLVPSLALMAQTVREWTSDSETPLRSSLSAPTHRWANAAPVTMTLQRSMYLIWHSRRRLMPESSRQASIILQPTR